MLTSACLQDMGGNDIQKQEIREAVELPLTHHELYRQIGIDPPRGVLLWGPPGTGKTMLAKAVAHHTTAAFIRVVGSEFVQKYLGEVGLVDPRDFHPFFKLKVLQHPRLPPSVHSRYMPSAMHCQQRSVPLLHRRASLQGPCMGRIPCKHKALASVSVCAVPGGIPPRLVRQHHQSLSATHSTVPITIMQTRPE